MTTDTSTERRGFLSGLISLLAAVPFVGGLFVAGRSATLTPHVDRPRRLELCKKSDVPDQGLRAQSVSYERRRGARVETVTEVVLLGKDENGLVFGMSSRCTHLGCPVVFQPDDQEKPLVCPCHDAVFSISGEPVSGPPNRPLDRLDVIVSNETVWLEQA